MTKVMFCPLSFSTFPGPLPISSFLGGGFLRGGRFFFFFPLNLYESTWVSFCENFVSIFFFFSRLVVTLLLTQCFGSGNMENI